MMNRDADLHPVFLLLYVKLIPENISRSNDE